MSPSPPHPARLLVLLVLLVLLAGSGCGGSTPPPRTEDTVNEGKSRKDDGESGGPTVEQELGSIDQRAVEQTFDKLQGKLEGCHKQGRDRVEYLAGEMKVFLRVGKDGRVRYAFFDESTLGDRDTEKCILDLFSATDWPKPKGGEAEVRNGFGWPAGSERQPTPWGPEKVSTALDEDKDVKGAVEKCKSGVSGSFRVTAYVEPGDVDGTHGSGKGPGKSSGKGAAQGGGKKHGKKGDKLGAKPAATPTPSKSGGEHGGKFKAIGVVPPGKEGADKVDCIVDAIKPLSLPSPGSYAAKVTFTL